LLTNEWTEEVKMISDKQGVHSAEYVNRIVNELCPRYHFVAGGDSFYRLSPYKNAKGGITHFICVAPCEEQLKDKYLFAVTIKPGQIEMAPESDANYLDNPYHKDATKESELGLTVQQRMRNQNQKKEAARGEVVVFF
jgi:hypothetical protein